MSTVWTGSIQIGLVNIPTKVQTIHASSRDGMTSLHRSCGSKLTTLKVCESCGETVGKDQLVKAVEVSKGEFVTFEEWELNRLSRSSVIEVVEFVPSVDRLLLTTPYWLAPPEPPAEKAFMLLREAMEAHGVVGVGRYTSHGTEKVVCLSPGGFTIVMHVVHRGAVNAAPVGDFFEFTDDEHELMSFVIGKMKSPGFVAEDYPDLQKQQLDAMIAAKREGKEVEAETLKEAKLDAADSLLDQLRRSVALLSN